MLKNWKSALVGAFLALPLFSVPAPAQQVEQNIMGNAPGATQHAIATDIVALANRCKIPLKLVESKGSLANFFGVRDRPNTQFGLVTSDMLEYMNAHEATNEEARRAVLGMRVMLPLYDAEVQVVASKDIRSLQDLNGRRVGVGPKENGAHLTSMLIFDILNVKPAERVNGTLDEMIELLRQGEIDAFMHVAGVPNPLIADGRIDDRFHIVPITDQVLIASYKPKVIPAGTYRFQPTDVPTVSHKILLMTYEYSSRKNAYYKGSCEAVANLTKVIVDNIDELRKTGHPKWKDVDLTEIPAGWEVAGCVSEGLASDFKPECSPPATASQASKANQEYLELLKGYANN